MGMFKNMLGAEESLFRDHVPLDFDYIPKLVPYREQEQRVMAACIRPLLAQRNGRNLFLYGSPGVGKTVACRHLLKELEEETEEVIPIYVNCWQKNTSYKITLEICSLLDYKFTHNKKTDELFKIIKDALNKKAVVLVLDEVDKLEDTDFLYAFLEEVYRKTVVLITNYRDWLTQLDNRIKSRLTAELLEFKPYNKTETDGILRERLKYAFVPGCWEEAAIEMAVSKAYELHDVRAGLYLLKEAGNAAEDRSSKNITTEHMGTAITKLEEFSIKKKDDLEDETKTILELIKRHSGKKIGDVFKEYQTEGGKMVYKTFQRKITKLAENRFISVKKIMGGAEGSTTIIRSAGSIKTLENFDDTPNVIEADLDVPEEEIE